MADVTSLIVNGAQLGNFVGKRVSIIGFVHEDNPGVSFTLESTDNIKVIIKMKKPILESINGYVQVKYLAISKAVLVIVFFCRLLELHKERQYLVMNYAPSKMKPSTPKIITSFAHY